MNKANSFEMVDCPVASLEGKALDYAVAIMEGGHSLKNDGLTWWVTLDGLTRVFGQGWGSMAYQPSSEWQHGGPIVERVGITLRVNARLSGHWVAFIDFGGSNRKIEARQTGPTPLVAAMRCHVAGELGDSVKIPKGLIEG